MKLTEGKSAQTSMTFEKLLIIGLAFAAMAAVVTTGLSLRAANRMDAAQLDAATGTMGDAGF
jgi:hypothetical protein